MTGVVGTVVGKDCQATERRWPQKIAVRFAKGELYHGRVVTRW